MVHEKSFGAFGNNFDGGRHVALNILVSCLLEPTTYVGWIQPPINIVDAIFCSDEQPIVSDPQPVDSELLVETNKIALDIKF